MKIEHRVATIIARQERDGWPFRADLARQYVEQLDSQADAIYQEIKSLLGHYYVAKSVVDKPFKKDGSLSKMAEEYGDVGGPFGRIEWHELELTQHAKVAERLVQLGWEPTAYTATGVPQIKPDGEPCPNLSKVMPDLGSKLSKYTKCVHRSNQIKGWLEALRPDGRVPAGANPNGTNTGRMTHKVVANVPKASPDVFFGTEMRSLFTHRGPGYKLVGFDAEGLELRIAAHYINSQEFIDALIHGDKSQGTDPHTRVLDACRECGVETRDEAKSCVYSTVYGASPRKVASILNLSQADGERIIQAVEGVFPGISTLKPKVEKAASRGYLIGLDGRKVWMRRDSDGNLMKHKALNYLFQSGGGIAMKVVLCYLDSQIKKHGADVTFVGNIHDEVQSEVHKDWIAWYNNSVLWAFEKATEFLQLRCPLAGEVQVGEDWSQTH
ncbi:DNA polymerase [Spiribacter sp. 390]|uniref:DNA polymerase n=2 Tax=Spiribacter pallidus TaxID=1987936 RepID=A0ABV3TGA4_9GAMM